MYPLFVVVTLTKGEIMNEFKVGDGATKGVGSDRYPYTIVEILSPKRVVLQPDDYYRTDKNGFSEMQTYEFTPNPEAYRIIVTLRKNGRWYQLGQTMGGSRFSLGHRDAYQDPSF
jgi:hypothetical protein